MDYCQQQLRSDLPLHEDRQINSSIQFAAGVNNGPNGKPFWLIKPQHEVNTKQDAAFGGARLVETIQRVQKFGIDRWSAAGIKVYTDERLLPWHKCSHLSPSIAAFILIVLFGQIT